MNITYEKDEVVIRIPYSAKAIAAAAMSKSGKNKMVATTSGFVPVSGAPDGVKLSLNPSNGAGGKAYWLGEGWIGGHSITNGRLLQADFLYGIEYADRLGAVRIRLGCVVDISAHPIELEVEGALQAGFVYYLVVDEVPRRLRQQFGQTGHCV